MLKLLYRGQKYSTKTVRLGGGSYRAIMADTPTKRMIGLMFRESLPKGSCMLFKFSSAGYHSVWMHNMRFPIDVLWLDSNGIVVDTRQGLRPCTSMLDCPQHSPKGPASYMMELNAGEIRRRKIREGSTARI